MARFEIWSPAGSERVHEPLHTVEAERIGIDGGAIVFRDSANNIVHIVVLNPGTVVKQVK